MSVSVKFEGKVALFRVVGNEDGIHSKDVVTNLNELQEIIKSNSQLTERFDLLNFAELKENASNEYFDEIFDLIAMYFGHDFADVFVDGRVSVYNAEDEEDHYYAIADSQITLKSN